MFSLLALMLQEGHGQAGGASGPFALEPGLIIWTWIVFLALFLLLRKFAWPFIVRATEERERTIQQQLADAERLNEEAKASLDKHNQLLAEAKDQAHELVVQAKSIGEKEREQLLARAREEQEEILERAKREIDAERDRALADLRREAVDLSLAAATKLIQQKLGDASDRKIVEQYLATLEDKS
ncbi:MAG: F0F1 ATP synthase subunit B [Gemmatimonadota bacterium]|nr:MAG: F0F1 ATP synthase subunit B [Gemmatimonadota bacterium]